MSKHSEPKRPLGEVCTTGGMSAMRTKRARGSSGPTGGGVTQSGVVGAPGESSRSKRYSWEVPERFDETSTRLRTLEQQRKAQLPAIRGQLVELHKHGRLQVAGMLNQASQVVSTVLPFRTNRYVMDELIDLFHAAGPPARPQCGGYLMPGEPYGARAMYPTTCASCGHETAAPGPPATGAAGPGGRGAARPKLLRFCRISRRATVASLGIVHAILPFVG